jgi:hypothetical protein
MKTVTPNEVQNVFCAFQMLPNPDGWPAECLLAVFNTKEALLSIYPTAIEKKRDSVKEEELGGSFHRNPTGPIVFEEFEVFSEPAKTTEPNGTIVEWGDRKMRVGRCNPGDTCLACDRIGHHLEPI